MANKSNGGKPPFDRLIAGIPQQLLESSLEHVSPQQPSRWDSLISKVAAESRSSPEILGKGLGLNPATVDDVIGGCPGDNVGQKKGMVYRWIEVNRKKATLKGLLEALYSCDETELVRHINQNYTTVSEGM